MAEIEFDVANYLDELDDDEVLAEVRRRNLHMPDGIFLDDIQATVAMLETGNSSAALDQLRSIVRIVLAGDDQVEAKARDKWKSVKAGQHPFLRMPAQ